jgi:DNA-binding transcriptional MerR regulator
MLGLSLYPWQTGQRLLLTVATVESYASITMRHPVEKERGRKFVGLPEFVSACERVMSEVNFEQARGTVTSVPAERTIRYYLAEGLVQPPEEKQGTASVYGYLHLLQLVVVKKMQAEHLPIRKIRELVIGKTEHELESLLGAGTAGSRKTSDSEAKKYLESLLTSSMQPLEENARPETASRQKRGMTSVPTTTQPRSVDSGGAWQRIEIEPGLELHVRSDYPLPTTSARTRSLTERIRAAISRYWKEK